MATIVAPSLLAANFLHLQKDIDMINKSEAKWLHFDVMDGVFVPNISFGIPILQAVRKATEKVIDVHLMIANNDMYIDAFHQAGANNLTVHYESSPHLHRTLQKIKQCGMKAGIAINPHTPINSLNDIITMADIVCIMSVNPGFGGQTFLPTTYQKVVDLKELILKKNATTLIEVDGGVTLDNASPLTVAGADILVAGNTVFAATNPKAIIKQLSN